MSDKMREFVAEVKQLCKDFSDQRDRPYMGDVHAALDGLYEQWQAAQSAAVPVVGDVVAYMLPDGEIRHGCECTAGSFEVVYGYPLIIQPAASISAAELDALRKDAERLDSGMIITSERDEFGEDYSCHRRGINLRDAIDAAIAGEKK